MSLITAPSPAALAATLADGFGVPRNLISDLHHLHRCQWQLEDASRAPGATPENVTIAKAAIDASNNRRHRLIDAIDGTVTYVPATDADHRYSETVGELCDRLLILGLKYEALASGAEATARLRRIESLADHLSTTIDHLLADAAEGRAQLPPRVGTKLYRHAQVVPVLPESPDVPMIGDAR